jgi:hypothetical protein
MAVHNDAISMMGQSVGGVTRIDADMRSVKENKAQKKNLDPFVAIQFDDSKSPQVGGLTEMHKQKDDIILDRTKSLPGGSPKK